MKKINLSLKKLLGLLQKKSYVLEAVYCENNLIKFVECRSPKYQKSFFIFIPDKYSMKYVYISTIKKHHIKLADDIPSSYHLEYVSDMKGEILDCDLVVVTGMDIFLYFDNSEYKYYHFVKDDPLVKKEKNKVSTLVNKTNIIKKELFKEEESLEEEFSDESPEEESPINEKEEESLEEEEESIEEEDEEEMEEEEVEKR